jgi:WhiB family transcriptional regulator, redox-sensing transcriptional regulator
VTIPPRRKRGEMWTRSPEWTGDEPCRETPDVFHPVAGDTRAAEIARWICKRCPSQQTCLDWAMNDPTLEGIHAGTTLHQRRRLRVRLREAM